MGYFYWLIRDATDDARVTRSVRIHFNASYGIRALSPYQTRE